MIGIGIGAGVVILICIFIYNSVIGKKNEVENANGGLDAQLKQRYDLIPNLESAVKKYMEHEKKVLEGLVELRGRAINKHVNDKDKQALNNQISAKLSGLMVQAEQYPELKSNENFISLQNTLYEIEENIAAARRFYNSAVTDYNNALEMFPFNIVAKHLKYKRKSVFSIPQIEKRNHNISKLLG